MPGGIIAAMPLVLLAAGLGALIAGSIVLRSFGPRYRVGRLLATTPQVTIGEARTLAEGPPRYVCVRGRIDAEEEFEDDAHRPLVFRRTRLESRRGRSWSAFDDRRETVAFGLREGLDGIAIDTATLDAGLIVLPRESVGTAADAPDRAPAGMPPTTQVRLRVEQISSVEHAIVLGVPRLDGPRGPTMTTGLGRPLILSTLERPEAMRILADGRTRRPLAAAILLAVGLVLLTLALGWALIDVLL